MQLPWSERPKFHALFSGTEGVVVGMLAILIARVKDDGQIGWLIPHLIKGVVSILQYADDTILFMKHDLEKTISMNSYFFFEQLLGLIKVRCIVSKSKGIRNNNISMYSSLCTALFTLGILACLSIDKKLQNSKQYPVECYFKGKLI